MTKSAPRRYDVVVVGAGPAGSTAAALLARRGLEVLLVEKERLPRPKVCGGCLSAGALSLLKGAGLGYLPVLSRSPRLERFELRARGSRLVIPTPGGRVITREDLDMELATAARAAGAELWDGTRARVGRWNGASRMVEMATSDGRVEVEAGVVVAAGGLAGALGIQDVGLRPVIHRRSRIGVGAVVQGESRPAGTVTMAVARGGYVGTAALGNGRTVVAAALSRKTLRQKGGVPETILELWKEAGVHGVPGIEEASWAGTPPLTRAVSKPAAAGLFLIGDAAGYEEPFTGEGMAWAVASALAAAPLAEEGVRRWHPGLARAWAARHAALLGWRRRRCRAVAQLVRSPGLAAAVGRALQSMPGVSSALAGAVTSAPRVPEDGR